MKINNKDENERFETIKAMNTLVKFINNETAYMRWIYLVPEEACEEDLFDFAKDEELFHEALVLFKRLWSNSDKCGLYIGGNVY